MYFHTLNPQHSKSQWPHLANDGDRDWLRSEDSPLQKEEVNNPASSLRDYIDLGNICSETRALLGRNVTNIGYDK